jgi:hypothetical protein
VDGSGDESDGDGMGAGSDHGAHDVGAVLGVVGGVDVLLDGAVVGGEDHVPFETTGPNATGPAGSRLAAPRSGI